MSKQYLEELKQFVELHIKSQNLQYTFPLEVLSRISSYNTETKGSWEYEWLQEGNRVLSQDKLEAIQCFNFARFPYVSNETQKKVYDSLLENFNTYVSQTDIKQEWLQLESRKCKVYTSNLDKAKPLLIVMGGIVSIKEQWYKFLEVGPKLGFSVIVTEFPKVGENTIPFRADSYRMLQEILDHFQNEVDVNHTYYVGMSFGGQLGIQCALQDSRIKGIVTVGAPLYEFYHLADQNWHDIPSVTRKTLSHVCELTEDELRKELVNFSIDVNALNRLKIPITYVFSLKDEIIPITELAFIKQHISNLDLITFDDVHGSPNYMGQIQQLIPARIMQQYQNNQYAIQLENHI
ncbi:alpha/beta fold hydrolase [Bacillus bingmayongensis]|uniref:alpha/beta fold hydrolase n=1 Tax=Bacillus bingmayongensis TaxID=1150157 RepID=UPI00031686AA|nr:alpha/beta fold hydrolase [Bacillus bingmayongensis]MBY0595854.1 alpha/beta hydrolase [Bacillus bingmayongensis]